MNKITVSICSSPTCYARSARLFKELGTILCTTVKEQIVLTGSSCKGFCAATGCPMAPCARINDRLICNATPGDVLEAVREELQPAQLVA